VETKILKKVLDANERAASDNRERFRPRSLFVLDVMGSPGAGKTLLLGRTLQALAPRPAVGVVVGALTGAGLGPWPDGSARGHARSRGRRATADCGAPARRLLWTQLR
jgi:hypothetical protein